MILQKCFACYSGYECEPEPCTYEDKATLETFFDKWAEFLWFPLFGEPTLCNIKSALKGFNIEAFNKLEVYRKEIDFLREFCSDNGASVNISDEGRLSWYWEDDSEYSGSSGIMDFEYNEEDAGGTWAYSEVVSTIRCLQDFETDDEWDAFVMPAEIIDDISLLQYISKYVPAP